MKVLNRGIKRLIVKIDVYERVFWGIFSFGSYFYDLMTSCFGFESFQAVKSALVAHFGKMFFFILILAFAHFFKNGLNFWNISFPLVDYCLFDGQGPVLEFSLLSLGWRKSAREKRSEKIAEWELWRNELHCYLLWGCKHPLGELQ